MTIISVDPIAQMQHIQDILSMELSVLVALS